MITTRRPTIVVTPIASSPRISVAVSDLMFAAVSDNVGSEIARPAVSKAMASATLNMTAPLK